MSTPSQNGHRRPLLPGRPRRRPIVELVTLAVIVVCYFLLATRGHAITWLWP